ncbi:MAG: YceI family protein [Planctomycetes bacterium]|nr:YceI family protein [Planctomycetota bacterium]
MKTLLLVPVLVAAFAAARPAITDPVVPADPAWQIDGLHSSVLFKVQHAGAANFYGCFNTVSGSFTLDEKNPADSTVELLIDAASIDTRDEVRDKHLRNADFFDVKQYPEIRFTSGKVALMTGDPRGLVFEIGGVLEIRGKKKDIAVQVVKTGEGEMNGKRIGYEAKFVLKRSEFGMDYGVAKKALGDEVTVLIAIEGVQPKK